MLGASCVNFVAGVIDRQTSIHPHAARLLIRYFCAILICELDICLDRKIVASLKFCLAAQAQSEAEEKS
jgi:hypothetical protein